MEKRVLSSEDLRNMDTERLFTSIIALWGMEGASQIVSHYFASLEAEKAEVPDTEEEYIQAVMEGAEAFAELVIRRLKQ